jgi:hypothetical protein
MRSGPAVIVAVMLIAVVAALLPLAYASPPDPTWVGGVWDDDDYDNVVLAAVRVVASVDGLAAFPPKPEVLVDFIPVTSGRQLVLASVDTPYHLRAPPA